MRIPLDDERIDRVLSLAGVNRQLAIAKLSNDEIVSFSFRSALEFKLREIVNTGLDGSGEKLAKDILEAIEVVRSFLVAGHTMSEDEDR